MWWNPPIMWAGNKCLHNEGEMLQSFLSLALCIHAKVRSPACFFTVSPEEVTVSAPPSVDCCATVCIFRSEQPHSRQLKFTFKRALINVAGCALSAVYNNNMAANRAEPSLRVHSCTSQRELQRKPPASQRIPRRAFVLH